MTARALVNHARWRWLLLLAALLFASTRAWAQNFPPLTGRVVDYAQMIPDAEEPAMVSKLKALETSTGRQLVVATVPDLQGYPLRDFSYQLGRKWGIGSKKENNGILLLVAKAERGIRIEVGYGLEPIMTDSMAGRIIDDRIKPAFKANDYARGFNNGIDAIAEQLALPPEEAAKRASQSPMAQPGKQQDQSLGTILFWLFILFFFILPVISPLLFGRRRRGRHYRNSYGSGPVIIWGGGSDWGNSGSSWGSGGWGGGGGGFSGGGGSFGGGGASGSW